MSKPLRFALVGSDPEALEKVKSILINEQGFEDLDKLLPDEIFNPKFAAGFTTTNPVELFKDAIKKVASERIVTSKINRLIVAKAFSTLDGQIIAVTKGQTKEDLVGSLNGGVPILDHFASNPSAVAKHAKATIDTVDSVENQIDQIITDIVRIHE